MTSRNWLKKQKKIRSTLEASSFEAMIKSCAYCLSEDLGNGGCVFSECPIMDNLKWCIDYLETLDFNLSKEYEDDCDT